MSRPEASAEPVRSSDGAQCAGQPVLERIATRSREIAPGFEVHRAVPSRTRRKVGAWCFLDHAGPIQHGPGAGPAVGPHPHIGLQTFTWMLEGEVLHRDSLGSQQLIRPGQVNLMTAGRGIVHAEEPPDGNAGRVHLTQLWIALPDAERQREPSFHHYPDLPILERGGFRITVLAGEALGERAPAQVFTPLVGIDLAASAAASTELPLTPGFEHAVLCLQGEIEVEGECIEADTLLYLGLGRDTLRLRCDGAARLLLIGGEPLEEDLLMWWNFVARTPEEVLQASEDWNAGRYFGDVPGTTLERIPAPVPANLNLKAQR